MTLSNTFNLPVTTEQVDGQNTASANGQAEPETVVETAAPVENNGSVEQMSRSEQFSAIGKMAASIMHDFKGPLTVIRGCAELLANPEIDDEKRKRYSDMILEDVNRFLTMSQDLLDYSRGAVNLEPKPVQLEIWLAKLTDSIRGGMGAAHIRLFTDLRFTGEVEMDEARVRRAVLNLVANAVDAMPEGGNLTILSELVDGKWRLSVSDTGHGILIDFRSRVFEPFVTQGKEYGTGLGLATAWEIVQGHGGSLNFETLTADEASGVGAGTTFVIELPLLCTPVPASQ